MFHLTLSPTGKLGCWLPPSRKKGAFFRVVIKISYFDMIILGLHANNGDKISKNDRDFEISEIYWQLCQNICHRHKMSVIRLNLNILRSSLLQRTIH